MALLGFTSPNTLLIRNLVATNATMIDTAKEAMWINNCVVNVRFCSDSWALWFRMYPKGKLSTNP